MRNNGPSSLLPLLFQVIDARIDLRIAAVRLAGALGRDAAAPATVGRRQCNVLLHFQSR
jgi:hypothetical protein